MSKHAKITWNPPILYKQTTNPGDFTFVTFAEKISMLVKRYLVLWFIVAIPFALSAWISFIIEVKMNQLKIESGAQFAENWLSKLKASINYRWILIFYMKLLNATSFYEILILKMKTLSSACYVINMIRECSISIVLIISLSSVENALRKIIQMKDVLL